VLLLFVVMLCRQLEVPEESTLSMVFDYIIHQHTQIDIYIKADNTNRREKRKKKKKTKKARTDLDQHCLVLFILIYPIQSSLTMCGGCSKMYYPIYMNWS